MSTPDEYTLRGFNGTPEDLTLTRVDISEYLHSGDDIPTPEEVFDWLVGAGYTEQAAGKVVSDLDSYL